MSKEVSVIEPTCVCGHPASHHYSEEETVYYSGLFNPTLAGGVETFTYVRCNGDAEHDPQGEPCSAMGHDWDFE